MNQDQNITESKEKNFNDCFPYIAKAGVSSYIILSIISAPFSLIVLFKGLQNGIPFNQGILGVLTFFVICFVWPFIIIWLASFKIILTNEDLIYKTFISRLFFKKKIIKFSEVKKINIHISQDLEADRKSAFYRLNIYGINIFSQDPLTINMKPFNQEDLINIVNLIFFKNPSIQIDKKVQELKDGNFSPIISTGIKENFKFYVKMIIAKIFFNIFKK